MHYEKVDLGASSVFVVNHGTPNPCRSTATGLPVGNWERTRYLSENTILDPE